MRRHLSFLLVVALLSEAPALAGLDGNTAAYIGGTVDAFVEAKDPVKGKLDTSDPTTLIFRYKERKRVEEFTIPYERVTGLEYGQKAGRRVGAAVGTAVLVSPVGLFLLFSKKRKHFLTIDYVDAAGKAQTAIFELGKKIVRTTLAVAETRSGKAVVYQDEEARKAGKGD